jgi:hypothetical protein
VLFEIYRTPVLPSTTGEGSGVSVIFLSFNRAPGRRDSELVRFRMRFVKATHPPSSSLIANPPNCL